METELEAEGRQGGQVNVAAPHQAPDQDLKLDEMLCISRKALNVKNHPVFAVWDTLCGLLRYVSLSTNVLSRSV